MTDGDAPAAGARMPARAAFLCTRPRRPCRTTKRASWWPPRSWAASTSRSSQRIERRGYDVFTERVRVPKLHARAHRAADLGAVAAVGDRPDAIRASMTAVRRSADGRRSFDAIVIGGGCAGFSAATALVESRRPRAGRRSAARPRRPRHGVHRSRNRRARRQRPAHPDGLLCRDARRSSIASAPPIACDGRAACDVPMIDRSGHHSVLALPSLPSPLHFLAGVLAWDALSWRERFSVLAHWLGTAIDRAATSAWRQAQACRSASGSSKQRSGAAAVRVVLGAARAGGAQSIDRSGGSLELHPRARAGVRSRSAAAALVLPAVPLDELYAEPSRAWLARARQRGARQRAGEGRDRWRSRDRRARARRADRQRRSSSRRCRGSRFRRCSTRRRPRSRRRSPMRRRWRSLPIVTVNLWFDRGGDAGAADRIAGPQFSMGLRPPRDRRRRSRHTCR